jgi:type I restriction enzyme, S subunit
MLPSLAEQRRIAAVLQACDQEIALLHEKRELLQQQKQGLMQKLLTGRVRVSVDPVAV